MRLRIGEFSLITSLSIKSLRLYHEKGILIPAEVDPDTGYRYYDGAAWERARAIRALRKLGFSLDEIGTVLEECADEADLLVHLEGRLGRVRSEIEAQEEIARSLESIIASEKEAIMQGEKFEIEEIDLGPVLVAGHRMTGRYDEVGKGLQIVCRRAGRHAAGPPMTLHYDDEYKEDGADMEPCVPLKKAVKGDDVSVRELDGGRFVSLVHRGPYDTLHHAYRRVFDWVESHGYEIRRPTREIYRKGPGLILRGNPQKYLTEIQIPVIGGKREPGG
jgi:effector-binding domain-containing protein